MTSYIRWQSVFLSLSFIVIILLSLMLSACGQASFDQTLQFSLTYSQQAVTCKKGLDEQGKLWQLSQFQMFIHDVEVADAAGHWYAVDWVNDDASASPTVGLVAQVCGGQSQLRLPVRSRLAPGLQAALRFKVGVPFELNHGNPLQQKSPLNQPGMFWSWQTGHKFLRLELDADDDHWLFHLGSTGCTSASSVRAPEKACKNPNIPLVTVPHFSANKAIELRLDRLFDSIKLGDASSCQSGPDNAACQILLANMGISGKSTVFGQ